jgi:DNA segregation ATPase FtsK/SpoIIIE, S-DNA-T family
LLGKGDSLFQKPGVGKWQRIQCAFVSDEEVVKLVEASRTGDEPQYDAQIMRWIEDEVRQSEEGDESDNVALNAAMQDPKLNEAMAIAARHGFISASFLQRQLKLGYNRAARLVEMMEHKGWVAPADGAKPRKWLGPAAS